MNYKKLLVILIMLLSGIAYYHFATPTAHTQSTYIKRVIDGDTLVLENNQKLRLKGVNSPEKGMLYYGEAKSFLQTYEDKTLEIEVIEVDIYGRLLVYAYYNDVLINEELVKNGLAHIYYYEKDKTYKRMKKAEDFARLNNMGIWKKSPYSPCIRLITLEHDEPEELILENLCSFDMNISLKDDATHIYKETLKANSVFTKNFSHIWNTGGDTLFIYDEEGLVLFYRY